MENSVMNKRKMADGQMDVCLLKVKGRIKRRLRQGRLNAISNRAGGSGKGMDLRKEVRNVVTQLMSDFHVEFEGIYGKSGRSAAGSGRVNARAEWRVFDSLAGEMRERQKKAG